MKLATILNAELINLDLAADTRDAAFDEMVTLACQKNHKLDHDAVLQAVCERESQQSTYLGKGLAMPHARIDSLNNFIIICARSKAGISYNGLSDKVHFFVMILSCKTKINILLQTMGAFATLFSDDAVVQNLMSVSSAHDFIDIIEKTGVRIKQTLVARDIMREEVITLKETQTLREVTDIFFAKNVSGTPVVNEEGQVQGVVTEKDIISVGIPKYMSMMDDISFLNEFEPFEEMFKKEDEITVKDIMSDDYTWVHDEVTVIQLAFYFVNKKCRRVLVINEDKKLLGLIMRKDLIRKVIHA